MIAKKMEKSAIEIFAEIKRTVKIEQYRVTHHAKVEMAEDDLNLKDITTSIEDGKIIEFYPKDFPFPSCLVYGQSNHVPIHSVWAYDKEKSLAVLVTVYRPDSERWIDFKNRRG